MPVYREGKHIGKVLDDVAAALSEAQVAYEFVLVDDGSPDDTWQVLEAEAARIPELNAIRLSRNFGKESALCAGMASASGDVVIVMDGDGQHPPSLIPKMIETWRTTHADIVEAVKLQRGSESLFNKISARLFYRLWNRLSGFQLTGASDYKLLTRQVVNAYLQMEERNVFFRGMTAWLGFRRERIPFEVGERAGGSSGWSTFRLLRLALTGITAFSALPLHVITLAGGLFMIFALIFGIETIIVLLRGNAVSGFATVIFLLLIIGGFVMISLGIIGEYLGRIYEEVKRRPRFIVGEVIAARTHGQEKSK
jgi:glycosyltransferase involved in cell wall biosynthesis